MNACGNGTIGIRVAIGAALAAGAVTLGACGGGDETSTTSTVASGATGAAEVATTTTTTSSTTEQAPTTPAAGGGSAAGDPKARAKEIVACLESEGFETIENPGNSSLGEEYNLIVGGSISVIHGYADDADAQKNLAKVEGAATQPADVDRYDDVVLEVRTSDVLDAAAIEKSRAASEACVSA